MRGGGQTQFLEASITNPFRQTQNPCELRSFVGIQVRQSCAVGPLQVRQPGSHFWQTIFSADLSS